METIKRIFNKYWLAVVQLIFVYACLVGGILWGLLFTDIYNYTTKDAWWAVLMRSFPILTLPITALVFLGMTFPPLPVEKEKITDWETELVIRWTTRGTYPILVQDVVRKTFNNLKQFNRIRYEVVTETSVGVLQNVEGITTDIYQEMVIPKSYQCEKGALFKARGLDYGAKFTGCSKDAYILHLDEESIVTADLYYGCRQFISENKGYIGQGVICYANATDSKTWWEALKNWQSHITHMADAMRCGDDHGRFRFQFLIGRNLVGMKGSYMLIPNSIEQETGFDHGKYSSITEDCWFALCNWDKIRFCRGKLVEQSPFTIRDTIKQRRRWATGLWLVCLHHPIAFYKKSFIIMQMIAWVLSPLVVVSFLASFVFYEYKMPIPIALILGFNFAQFNAMYIYGSLHNVYSSWWSKILHTLPIPILLPFFMIMEGVAGVWGTFWPATGFDLVQKQSDAQSSRQSNQSTQDLAGMDEVVV